MTRTANGKMVVTVRKATVVSRVSSSQELTVRLIVDRMVNADLVRLQADHMPMPTGLTLMLKVITSIVIARTVPVERCAMQLVRTVVTSLA